MTPELLAHLREDKRRCWWCGCHPPEQPHADDCKKPPNLSHTWRPIDAMPKTVAFPPPPPPMERPW